MPPVLEEVCEHNRRLKHCHLQQPVLICLWPDFIHKNVTKEWKYFHTSISHCRASTPEVRCYTVKCLFKAKRSMTNMWSTQGGCYRDIQQENITAYSGWCHTVRCNRRWRWIATCIRQLLDWENFPATTDLYKLLFRNMPLKVIKSKNLHNNLAIWDANDIVNSGCLSYIFYLS